MTAIHGVSRTSASMLGLLVLCSASACSKMSVKVEDETAGINGGFEVAEDGIPVNWQIYGPSTVPDADFDLILDTTEFHSGEQSLEFVVRSCACGGGWRSPGFANEFDILEEGSYKIGFWAKSDGAHFRCIVGGVTAFEGEFVTLFEGSAAIPEWKHFESRYTVPRGNPRLRLQFSVQSPGRFWIDDLTIERIES